MKVTVSAGYFFFRYWFGKKYYLGVCLECSDGSHFHFSEKANFFKKVCGQCVFPPETVSGLFSLSVDYRHWYVQPHHFLFPHHMQELYKAIDFQSFAEMVERAIAFHYGLAGGKKNILVTQSEKTRNRDVFSEPLDTIKEQLDVCRP
ncbi:MAG: hypothetical protein EOP45_14055 [Sphingobacteriaceae bacterium]|nr:MAG: hypothetical protein EOP45_14055 [Sphingobacteriaceae bacterium]